MIHSKRAKRAETRKTQDVVSIARLVAFGATCCQPCKTTTIGISLQTFSHKVDTNTTQTLAIQAYTVNLPSYKPILSDLRPRTAPLGGVGPRAFKLTTLSSTRPIFFDPWLPAQPYRKAIPQPWLLCSTRVVARTVVGCECL
jgi:hypothetical protein